jgi:general secretion pathway protein G
MKNNGFSLGLNRHTSRRGFTLIELLLVMAILSLLAAIVFPNYIHQGVKARIGATITQMGALKNALAAYEVDNGSFPSSRDGLNALVRRPRDAKGWQGPYIEKVPKDAWKGDFLYVCPGLNNPDSYDLISAGPDGKTGTDDDLRSWELDE